VRTADTDRQRTNVVTERKRERKGAGSRPAYEKIEFARCSEPLVVPSFHNSTRRLDTAPSRPSPFYRSVYRTHPPLRSTLQGKKKVRKVQESEVLLHSSTVSSAIAAPPPILQSSLATDALAPPTGADDRSERRGRGSKGKNEKKATDPEVGR
jgi:hypothetical protein